MWVKWEGSIEKGGQVGHMSWWDKSDELQFGGQPAVINLTMLAYVDRSEQL
jgi:hypothetical protein